MTRKEFARWIKFYRMNPFDDSHRYHRPAALVRMGQGGKAELDDLLRWLQHDSDAISDADANTMRAFGYNPGARG